MNTIWKFFHDADKAPLDGARVPFVEALLSGSDQVQRYVLGRNEQAARVARELPLNGVVDDFAAGMEWMGLPVISLDELPGNAVVVNCSLSISPLTVKCKLDEAAIYGSMYYSDLHKFAGDRFPLPDFVVQSRTDVQEHAEDWKVLLDGLEDEESRQVLNDVLKVRLTANPDYLNGYSLRLKEQYFEDFLRLDDCPVFVDVGGFDGDTTEQLLIRYPNCGKVHFFEPSYKNLAAAKKRLQAYANIKYYQMGLSDRTAIVSFDEDGGAASSVTVNGSCKIEVTTLDRCIDEQVSVVKMDIEGLEKQALVGARRHLYRDRPRLAIAAYHAPEDLRLIYQYVKGIHPDYRVFLRHYTEGLSETVLFFV